jgi:hypothetical protein
MYGHVSQLVTTLYPRKAHFMTKMNTSALITVLALVATAAPVSGQQKTVLDQLGTAVLTSSSGGSVRIPHGMFVVSRNSNLELQWLMVTDASLGIVFREPVGAKGIWDEPWYRYSSNMKMKAVKDVSAFEVRILTFNIWGEFTGTLSFSQLEDMDSGQEKDFERVWGIYPESQLRPHFTTIAYVANVRLRDGHTISADPALVLKAAQAIKSTITLQDLQPKAEPMPMAASKS